MKHILLFVAFILCVLVQANAKSTKEEDWVNGSEVSGSSKLIAVVRIVNPKENGNGRPKVPKQYGYIELYSGKVRLFGKFDYSVLTLLSADGQQLCQVAVPQGADEVDIPVLSDIPVEVHINDGVDDYYGYIQ